jgi:hypothetical protein
MLGIGAAVVALAVLAVLFLHHALAPRDLLRDSGLRPVDRKPAITWSGSIPTGPAPTPPALPSTSPAQGGR